MSDAVKPQFIQTLNLNVTHPHVTMIQTAFEFCGVRREYFFVAKQGLQVYSFLVRAEDPNGFGLESGVYTWTTETLFWFYGPHHYVLDDENQTGILLNSEYPLTWRKDEVHTWVYNLSRSPIGCGWEIVNMVRLLPQEDGYV